MTGVEAQWWEGPLDGNLVITEDQSGAHDTHTVSVEPISPAQKKLSQLATKAQTHSIINMLSNHRLKFLKQYRCVRVVVYVHHGIRLSTKICVYIGHSSHESCFPSITELRFFVFI